MSQVRERLFSVHTHSSGAIALYLEEEDAVKDLVQDVVGAYELSHLDNLQASARANMRDESYGHNLDTARADLDENAPLVCNMSETEALNLAEDLMRAVKFARIGREAQGFYPGLKSVK